MINVAYLKGAVRAASRGEADGRTGTNLRQQAGPHELGARQRDRRGPQPAHHPRPTLEHSSVLGAERRRRQGRPQLDQQEHPSEEKVEPTVAPLYYLAVYVPLFFSHFNKHELNQLGSSDPLLMTKQFYTDFNFNTNK